MDYPEWKTEIAAKCPHKVGGRKGRGKKPSKRAYGKRCMFQSRNWLCRIHDCPMKEEKE